MTAQKLQIGRARAFGTLGTTIGGMVLLWGVVIASFPLEDNSFFTHLATGRLILERGSVPSSDPYTYTAEGVDWTVQSWLPSVVYAGAERFAGDAGLRAVVLLSFLAAGWLVWRLSRNAQSLVPRLLLASVAMSVSTGLWSERPYMVGVIGLGVVWLSLDRQMNPWWLVPVLWVWANSHGSYPLAVVLVLAVIGGTALDRRRGLADADDVTLRAQWTVLGATAIGIIAAVIGPLGLDVLTFPFKAVTQSGVLADIIEWQAPGFRSTAERAFLVLVLATFAGLVRAGRWRLALPALVFAGAALYAQRNVVLATIVLVPVLADCLPSVGTLRSSTRPGLGAAFSTIVSAVVAMLAFATLSTPVLDGLRGYPAHGLAWLDASGHDDRLIAQATTGNFLEVLDGPRARVFVDDRADMFPRELFADAVKLERGTPGWSQILAEYDGNVVVWERGTPLAALLAADPRWRIAYADTRWVVACSRGSGCQQVR